MSSIPHIPPDAPTIRADALSLMAQARLGDAITHKLNNNLTSISNYIFILKQQGSSENTMRLIEKVESNFEQIRVISRGIADTGFDINEAPTEINLADCFMDAAMERLGGRGLMVQRTAGKGDFKVKLRRKAFAHAVGLVSENALHFGASSVELAVSQEQQGYTCTITDNACGIPEADLERVFEPLFSTKPKPAPPEPLPGLGLFHAALISSRLGIGLSLSSILGKGTAATFLLPR